MRKKPVWNETLHLIFPCAYTWGLLQFWEYFVTVDHFDRWGKHIVFSKKDGSKLKQIVTQRYATILVFISLLLNAELNVLFSPSEFGENIRKAMTARDWTDLNMIIGILLCVSICTTIFAIISTVTAWGAINVVSDANILFLLRSDIGRIVTSLPFKYITLTLYLFMGWMSLAIGILMPSRTSIFVLSIAALCFLNMVSHYSTFLNIIMRTGAMKEEAMFDEIHTKCGGSELDELLMLKTREKEDNSYNTKERLNSSVVYHESLNSFQMLDRRKSGLTSNTIAERVSDEEKDGNVPKVSAPNEKLEEASLSLSAARNSST